MTESHSFEEVEIRTEDGYLLSARHFRPDGPKSGLLLISAATGVPQRYYVPFANHMVDRGFEVVTYDYRGIAASKRQSLKGFKADIKDWGLKDYKAVLNYSLTLGTPLVVGHSLGGHVFGLVPESNQTLGLCTFATGAGWHGHMPYSERLRVMGLWQVLGPILTRFNGYLPSKKLGLGENLPLGVYKQWRHWCSFPGYWFDDSSEKELVVNFKEINVPILAINAKDDLWAPKKSVEAFMQHYSGTNVTYKEIDPKKENTSIGHMGYFHTRNLHLTCEIIQGFLNRLN